MINLKKLASKSVDEIRILPREQAIEVLAILLAEAHDAGVEMAIKQAKEALSETFAFQAPKQT